MFEAHRLLLFFAAAVVLSTTPGPGIFYVPTRSLAGGKREGILSSLGTLVGGLFHVFNAALGLSALLASSAIAFHSVKYAGAASPVSPSSPTTTTGKGNDENDPLHQPRVR